MPTEQEWMKKAPCVVINCGDGHGDHHDKKGGCCDACDSAHETTSFVGNVDLGNIAPVATEIPFALLTNPVGSGKNLVITSRGLAVTGSDDLTALLRFYFDPTVTAPGTPASPVNVNVQTPPLPAGSATFSTAPGITVTANGTLIDALNTGSGQSELTGKLVLGEGHSLLVTGRANAENTRAAAFIHWTECRKHMRPEPTPAPGGGTGGTGGTMGTTMSMG